MCHQDWSRCSLWQWIGERRRTRKLSECKTTVLNTRGWSISRSREKERKSRRLNGVRHMRIGPSIFLQQHRCSPAVLLYLVVIDEGWSRAEQSECRWERERERDTQEISRRCRISSFPSVDQIRKSSSLRKLLAEEKQRTVFLSLSRSLEWLCSWACQLSFSLSLSLDLTKGRMLLSHRANIRERERERERKGDRMLAHVLANDLLLPSFLFAVDLINSAGYDRLISLSSSSSSMNYRRPTTRPTRNGHKTVIVSSAHRKNETVHLLSDVSGADRPALGRSKMKWKMSEIKWQ